ncbi:Methyltransf 31 domain containing protein [Trichuris trichiura]|uniref:Methyltransf 31 domain containing protein n=1 Tax=Trichuris trichiura TaxID=36087 RepID=A0A077Z486_TRITR|nr:Methyltransf 31 domain containing protein [Trichuris trichiura]
MSDLQMLSHEQLIPRSSQVVDIGCGNASLLIKMSKCNFTHLTGLDYSANSLDLANRIAAREGCEIQFEVCHCDILCLPKRLEAKFDIVLDKGTFDVIYMRGDSEHSVPLYVKNVLRLFRTKGGQYRFLLIASCNCTEKELRSLFLQGNIRFLFSFSYVIL